MTDKMRKGWEIKKLGEICDIKHGFAFEGKDFENDYLGENPIVLTPGNFSENSSLVFNERNTKRCLGLYPKEYEFQVGDFVVVMTDLSSKMKILGRPAIIESDNILHNQRIGKFVFFDNTLDKTYLFYLLQTESYLKEIKSSATGTMVRHTAPKRILDYKVPIPPLPEQQRIASILDEAFGLIEKAKLKIEKNLQNAKELFQSELNSIFTSKGEGWEEKTLGELTTKIGSGATPRGGNESYKSEGISLIRSMNVHDNFFKEKNLAFIDDKQAKELANVTLEEGDVLLNITGASVARCCVIPIEYLPARVNQHVSILRPKKGIVDSFFLNHLLLSKVYKDQLLETGEQGSTRQAITKVQLVDFKIKIPSIIEQQKIVHQLDTLSAETKRLEAMYQQKLDALEELKKSILQKAFSGELKVEN